MIIKIVVSLFQIFRCKNLSVPNLWWIQLLPPPPPPHVYYNCSFMRCGASNLLGQWTSPGHMRQRGRAQCFAIHFIRTKQEFPLSLAPWHSISIKPVWPRLTRNQTLQHSTVQVSPFVGQDRKSRRCPQWVSAHRLSWQAAPRGNSGAGSSSALCRKSTNTISHLFLLEVTCALAPGPWRSTRL